MQAVKANLPGLPQVKLMQCTLQVSHYSTFCLYSVTAIDTPNNIFVIPSDVTTRTLLYVPNAIPAGIFSSTLSIEVLTTSIGVYTPLAYSDADTTFVNKAPRRVNVLPRAIFDGNPAALMAGIVGYTRLMTLRRTSVALYSVKAPFTIFISYDPAV